MFETYTNIFKTYTNIQTYTLYFMNKYLDQLRCQTCWWKGRTRVRSRTMRDVSLPTLITRPQLTPNPRQLFNFLPRRATDGTGHRGPDSQLTDYICPSSCPPPPHLHHITTLRSRLSSSNNLITSLSILY